VCHPVEQQGLQSVHGFGEPGLGSAALLELLPECLEALRLVDRKQAEDVYRRSHLPLVLIGTCRTVVQRRVACVDLDEIVQEDELDGVSQVNGLVEVLGEDRAEARF
jgi:hypothetical protein